MGKGQKAFQKNVILSFAGQITIKFTVNIHLTGRVKFFFLHKNTNNFHSLSVFTKVLWLFYGYSWRLFFNNCSILTHRYV